MNWLLLETFRNVSPFLQFPPLCQSPLSQLEEISPSSAVFSLSLSSINFAFEIFFVPAPSLVPTANPRGLALIPCACRAASSTSWQSSPPLVPPFSIQARLFFLKLHVHLRMPQFKFCRLSKALGIALMAFAAPSALISSQSSGCISYLWVL